MNDLWFAGTFCPRGATCSEGDDALTPSNGPKIRTLKFDQPPTETLTATVAEFLDRESFYQANTQSEDCRICAIPGRIII